MNFYRLSAEERAVRMRALGVEALKRWDAADDQEPELVKLRENAVFKVQGPGGAPAALRIHRHGYHTDAELDSELIWMAALREGGIGAPGFVRPRSGALFETVAHESVPEPRQVDMLEWLDGEPFGSVEEGLSGAVTDLADAFAKVGSLAARLHNHVATWPLPAGFTRHAWDLDGLTGEAPFWGRFWELGGLSTLQRKLIEAARDRTRGDLIAYGQRPETYGLIHADFNMDNVLIDGDEVRVVDFDDAGFGWHLFDLSTVSCFLHGEAEFDVVRQSVIDGYRRESPLPDHELEAMPLFYLLRGFTYLGWVHTRYQARTAQVIEPKVIALVCRLAEDYMAG